MDAITTNIRSKPYRPCERKSCTLQGTSSCSHIAKPPRLSHLDLSYMLPKRFSIFKLSTSAKSDKFVIADADSVCDAILSQNLKDRIKEVPENVKPLKHFVAAMVRNLRRVHLGKMIHHHCRNLKFSSYANNLNKSIWGFKFLFFVDLN